MANNFPSIGVNAVVQNAAQYTQQVNKVASDTETAGNKIKGAAEQSGNFGKGLNTIISSISKFIPGLSEITSKAGEVTEAVGGVAEGAGEAGVAIAGVSASLLVAGAAIGAFIALATRGAGFSDIEHGFDVLTAAVGQAADAMITKLHDASQGTIDDMKLMQITNQALIGVNNNLGKSLGQDLPQMMTIARNIALATGQDTTQVFDSITEAVKRGQTRMLQSIGIVIDQKKAFDDYAKSMNISVKSMDKAQQEQAILNAVMDQGTKVSNALGNSQESNATKMQQAGTTISNVIDNISKVVQPVFSGILDIINGVLSSIGDAINSVAPYIEAIVGFIMTGIRAIGNVISGIWNGIVQFVQKVLGIGDNLKSGAKNIFEGAANMIGALAGGIMYAANTYVYPAIISIANFIASFLSGLSPPPMGPLHTIDQGGANVMLAWLEGATGVSLEPISQVAANVKAALGSAANESMAQVKARLLELDEAIAPFQEQLDLVKTRFDQIKAVTSPAIDAIDRQISILQQALAKGDQNAAAQIKTLDDQKQKLQDYVDVQQEATDQAQIQLALAQLQQGTERAQLQTREAMLKQEASLTTATPKGQKPKQGKGGGATSPDDGSSLNLTNPANQTSAEQAGQDLAAAYSEGFKSTAGDTGQAIADANASQLKAAGNKISAAVGNIGKQLDTALVQPFKDTMNKIGTALGGLFDGGPNSIQTWLKGLPGAFMSLGASLQTNLVAPIGAAIGDAIQFFLPGNQKGLWAKLANFVTVDLPTALSGLGETIRVNIVQPFLDKVNDVKTGISNFFTSEGPGTLHGIFDDVMTFFKGLPDKVKDALSSFVGSVITHVVDPIVDGLNGAIVAVQDFINNVLIKAVNTLLINIAAAKAALTGQSSMSITPVATVTFGSIPYPKIAGAAEGGLFSGGLLQTHANELIAPADKIGVFPQNFVTALDRLTNVLMHPVAASISQNTTYNNSGGNTFNFNGIQSNESAIMEFARLQAVVGH